jgi:hypothetical protein
MRGLLVAIVLSAWLAACAAPPLAPTASSVAQAVAGHAVAGPTCPVQPANPAPGQCAPAPVAGATLVVTDGTGATVATLTTAQDGAFSTALPDGTYTLTPQPVPGLMGGAPPLTIAVSATEHPTDLVVTYDTGIR